MVGHGCRPATTTAMSRQAIFFFFFFTLAPRFRGSSFPLPDTERRRQSFDDAALRVHAMDKRWPWPAAPSTSTWIYPSWIMATTALCRQFLAILMSPRHAIKGPHGRRDVYPDLIAPLTLEPVNDAQVATCPGWLRWPGQRANKKKQIVRFSCGSGSPRQR